MVDEEKEVEVDEEEEGDKVEEQVEVEIILVEGNDSVRTNQDNHLPLPPVRTVARTATPATRDDNDHDLHLVDAVIDNDNNTTSINRYDIMIHSRRRSSRRH